ncbi:hypothetical protein XI04_03220 [Bradyrhizobium sp. CCBAU 11430]|nr:hypothetical protein [Bradyrhizobium sp. CCBAU 11430]
MFEVDDDRIAYFLRQRKPRLPPGFAGDGKPPIPPIDIGELEVGDLARPQAKTGEQQDDRPIT